MSEEMEGITEELSNPQTEFEIHLNAIKEKCLSGTATKEEMKNIVKSLRARREAVAEAAFKRQIEKENREKSKEEKRIAAERTPKEILARLMELLTITESPNE